MTEDLPHLRCYTCGKILADKFLKYNQLLEDGVSIEDALYEIGLTRYCCRSRMMAPIKVVSSANRQTDPNEPVTLMNQNVERLSVALDSEAPTDGALAALKDNITPTVEVKSNEIQLPSLSDLATIKKETRPTTSRIYRAN